MGFAYDLLRAVFRGDDVGLQGDVASRDVGVAACSGPAPETFNSTGLRTSVETALAPAREGYGGCAGANDGPIAHRISVSRMGTKQPCSSVVGRLLDALDKGPKRCVRPATPCNYRFIKIILSTIGFHLHAGHCVSHWAPSEPRSEPA